MMLHTGWQAVSPHKRELNTTALRITRRMLEDKTP